MKTQLNDNLFQNDIDKPFRLEQPDKCDKTCVKFHDCSFPPTCKVKVREKQGKGKLG